MAEPIKVMIIDDNKEIRFLIKMILEEEKDINVACEAENLAEARTVLETCRPDLALLDISIDGAEGGLKFLQEISKTNLATDTIILSAHAEAIYAEKSIKAGAKGYICKEKVVEYLASAIRTVQSGREFISWSKT